jgi:signal transduction histidine kinase
MRSLAWRLTAAFLVVSLTASLLMAGLIAWQTRRQFDRFVLERLRTALLPALVSHYQLYGDWQGIDAVIEDEEGVRLDRIPRNFAAITLEDEAGTVVYQSELSMESTPTVVGVLPVVVDEVTVGRLVLRLLPPLGDSPEAQFLRRSTQTIVLGMGAATLMALGLGLILARTLTQPLRALTEATQAMARGALGTQVEIGIRDEVGELGMAFNQMSRDLAHSTQVRRQMTADIAHDLRTPLSVILGYTEALHDGKLPGEPAVYAILHDEAQHLNRLIQDLRVLSLADADELPLQRAPTPPRDLLERSAAAHRVQAQAQGIGLTVDAAPDLPWVDVDPERMAQVLGNLVSNALRYTPTGGAIRLTGATAEGRVTLAVIDSGRGIAPEDLPYIFERFYRGDKARSQTGESGLGLAIAKSLVEMQGGTLTVGSASATDLPTGTTFTVTLPAAG